ncbi:MAG: DUF3380 domain-containing protein [Nanoarchaeales archaeon]|nr:DUF3380 domain-containing protein [Nanoarchaeales archaeon]
MKSNSKSIYSNSNKKGTELPMTKLVSILILSFTILAVLSTNIDLFLDLFGSEGKSKLSLISLKEKCEISEGRVCKVVICYDSVEPVCTDTQKFDWVVVEKYYKKCSKMDGFELSKDDYKKLECGALYTKIKEVIKKHPDYVSANPLTEEDAETKTAVFKSNNFFNSYNSKFEKHADNHSYDVNLVYAILIKEEGYKTYDSVRFECHLFNKKSSKKVPCTIEKGSSFSRVPSETNVSAYLYAQYIDKELAFKSSSFGFAQMMGYNILEYGNNAHIYELVDLSLVEDQDYMIDTFFTFLEKNYFITNLKEKDFPKIAEKYNGENYVENNYDVDLEIIYNSLS